MRGRQGRGPSPQASPAPASSTPAAYPVNVKDHLRSAAAATAAAAAAAAKDQPSRLQLLLRPFARRASRFRPPSGPGNSRATHPGPLPQLPPLPARTSPLPPLAATHQLKALPHQQTKAAAAATAAARTASLPRSQPRRPAAALKNAEAAAHALRSHGQQRLAQQAPASPASSARHDALTWPAAAAPPRRAA